jgi:DNA replication protein DnaC
VRGTADLHEEGFGELVICPDCGLERRIRRITETCGLVGEEFKLALSDWRPGPWPDLEQQRRRAKHEMYRTIDDQAGFLTFWGDFGAGKTMALQIIINALRLRGVACHYAPFSLLASALREAMFSGDRRDVAARYWRWITDLPALAIDEVTRFNATDWARERLWMLSDTRYRRREEVLTVMATNDDPTVAMGTDEAVGYLFSRMRQGALVELRGDMRTAAK